MHREGHPQSRDAFEARRALREAPGGPPDEGGRGPASQAQDRPGPAQGRFSNLLEIKRFLDGPPDIFFSRSRLIAPAPALL